MYTVRWFCLMCLLCSYLSEWQFAIIEKRSKYMIILHRILLISVNKATNGNYILIKQR